MAFTSDELAAIARLEQYNTGTYHAVTNEYGLGGIGYRGEGDFEGNWDRCVTDIALISTAITREAATVSDNSDELDAIYNNIANINTLAGIDEDVTTLAAISGNVTTAAGIAAAITAVANASAAVIIVSDNIAAVNSAADNMAAIIAAPTEAAAAAAARDAAETYRDQTAAIVTSSQFPVATTTGTGDAYVADFDPNIVIADGAAFRLNLHTANTVVDPVLTLDGVEYDLVRDTAGNGFGIGEMPTGFTGIFYYESTTGDVVLANAQKVKWFMDVNLNSKRRFNEADYKQFVIDGEVSDTEADKYPVLFRAMRPMRLVSDDLLLLEGTCTFTWYKISGGTETAIPFGVGADVERDVTDTGTDETINNGGDAYIDLAAGDYLAYTITDAAAAVTLTASIYAIEDFVA